MAKAGTLLQEIWEWETSASNSNCCLLLDWEHQPAILMAHVDSLMWPDSCECARIVMQLLLRQLLAATQHLHSLIEGNVIVLGPPLGQLSI